MYLPKCMKVEHRDLLVIGPAYCCSARVLFNRFVNWQGSSWHWLVFPPRLQTGRLSQTPLILTSWNLCICSFFHGHEYSVRVINNWKADAKSICGKLRLKMQYNVLMSPHRAIKNSGIEQGTR